VAGFEIKRPYPDFPLTPHASGRWCRKIRGQLKYFTHWAKRINGKLERVEADGWQAALELYKQQAEDLHSGRTPRPAGNKLTVKQLFDRFLTAKHRKMEAGEMQQRTYHEYCEVLQIVADRFGKDRRVEDLAADDFEALRAYFATRWGPVRIGKLVVTVKSVFKHGLDNGLLERPMKYGSEFTKPGKAVLRRHRAKAGPRMFEPAELRELLKSADPTMKAAILLGLNCGFGNSDVASLPLSAVDLDASVIDYPRPKTGIPRRCPLWIETVEALKALQTARPAATAEAAELFFVNERGGVLVRVTPKSRTDCISINFLHLLQRLQLHRPGRSFYTLRHVHRTISDGARDRVAADTIMGHSDNSMASHYVEKIDDSRLRAVADHVRAWLFNESTEAEHKPKQKSKRKAKPAKDAGTQSQPGSRPMLRIFNSEEDLGNVG
jgi:integrase